MFISFSIPIPPLIGMENMVTSVMCSLESNNDMYFNSLDFCTNTEEKLEENVAFPPSCTDCAFPVSTVFTRLDCTGGVTVSQLISLGTITPTNLLGINTVGDYSSVLNFIVCGKLIVDVPLAAINCNFLMEEGSEIKVNSNITFSSPFSTFKGCLKMWKGISVEGWINAYYSEFRDAEIAINLLPGSSIGLLNAQFIDDYIGIKQTGDVNVSNIGISVWGAQFNSTGNLKSPYAGQQNYSYPDPSNDYIVPVKPFAAVYLDHGMMDLSYSYISGHRNGIIAQNESILDISNINMLNFEFTPTNIFTTSNDLTYRSGYGIYTHRVINFDSNDNNISDCEIGIEAQNNQGSIINISNNAFNNITSNTGNYDYAVHIWSGSNSDINVSDNNVTNCYNGIRISSHDEYGAIRIKNNVIVNCNSPIDISGNNSSIENRIFIENNDITINSNLNVGIDCSEDDNISIINNNINFNNSATGWGIVAYGDKCELRNNIIEYDAVGTNKNGIICTNNQDVVFCCNTISKAELGVFMAGSINGTASFRSTTIENCANGLFLSETEIGVQPHAGNLWFNNTVGAELYTSGNYMDAAQGSQFLVNYSQSGVVPSVINPSSISLVWFKPESGSANFCSEPGSEDCGIAPYLDGGGSCGAYCLLQSNDCTQRAIQPLINIATGQLANIGYTDYNLWAGQYYLLKEMELYPQIVTSCNTLSNFYNTHQSGIIRDYLDAELAVADYVGIEAIQNAQVIQYQSEIDLLQNDIQSIRSTIDINNPDFTKIDSIKSMYLSMGYKQDAIHQIIDLYHNAIIANYNTVYQQVDQLSATQPYHYVQKEMLRTRLLVIRYGLSALSAAQWSIVDDIADRCPTEVGNGVFYARALNAYNGVVYPTNFDPCISTGKRLANQSTDLNSEINIYPNPSSGVYRINIGNQYDDIDVIITDTKGEIIFKSTSNENKIFIDLQGQASGIYICNVYGDNLLLKTERLVLIR